MLSDLEAGEGIQQVVAQEEVEAAVQEELAGRVVVLVLVHTRYGLKGGLIILRDGHKAYVADLPGGGLRVAAGVVEADTDSLAGERTQVNIARGDERPIVTR